MNTLSLFDGMSCGQIALDQLGIKVDNYYAAEIDKYAIEIAKKNYPNTIHLGDVTKIKGSDLPKIDLLIGGSPCQGFSFAGKQLNFDDPRSALFFEFVRLLKECKPKYFLLENVRMKKEYQDIISEHLGVEPIMINSALVSAQNRVRLYWTNIPNITQPEDKKIVLKDVLKNEPEYELSDAKIDRVLNSPRGKGYFYEPDVHDKIGTVIAGYHKEPTDGSYVATKPIQVGTADDIKGYDCIKRVYSPEGKSPTLTTMEGGHRQPKVVILQKPRGNNKGGYRAINGKTPTLTSNSWEQNNFVTDKTYYRKLTPLECERLQTVPDGYTEGVSNTQRYKMLGNGWTVEVIKHILREMIR